MENASKALIIAGAILLSILIISLGIMIFNQAKDVVTDNQMTELQVTQFNSKFQTYMGENIRGAQVNSLINQVVQSNVQYNQTDDSKLITVNATAAASDWTGTPPNSEITAPSGSAKTGRTFDVEYDTNPDTGLIDEITISSHTSTGP